MIKRSGQKLSKYSFLQNQKGQMAIFVALIFQVLFVLFAMAINVALVVHDKINLQNSVDLAAYYGAQRQAEHLNVIAHMNYQIRQSWKLLSWRYRVLGTMGLETPRHPVKAGGNFDEVAFFNATNMPSICVFYHPVWKGVPLNASLCKEESQVVPQLSPATVINFLNPFTSIFNQATAAITIQSTASCNEAAAFNYWFAATIMKSFREDQANRKEVILALAKNLQRPGAELVDINGDFVMEGVRNVIFKNLTHGNRDLQKFQVDLLNSLEAIPTENWLSEIGILPTVIYTDADTATNCATTPRDVSQVNGSAAAQQRAKQIVGDDDAYQQLVAAAQPTRNDASPLYNHSIGFEKNPWQMAYVGVKAETETRQLFFPFGKNLTLRARAYAKPFGGRIGPWFYKLWPKGSLSSVGTRATQTDKLLTSADINGAPATGLDDHTRMPNFSKYPGDSLGLNSRMAAGEITGLYSSGHLDYAFYTKVANKITRGGEPERMIAWDHQNDKAALISEKELAAIAPDLFDITYYSIEPNFSENYLAKIDTPRARTALGIPDNLEIRGDLGESLRSPTNNSEKMNIQKVIAQTEGANLYRPGTFYKVRDRKELLTSWVPDGVENFKFDAEDKPQGFGDCEIFDDLDSQFTRKVPGSCLMNGGRVGYSVKMISRDSLINGEYKFGSQDSGQISNPPNEDDGW